MKAAKQGQLNLVTQLLNDQVGQISNRGWTALMYAASANHAKVVSILAPYEACTFPDGKGGALFVAVQNDAYDCIRILAPLEAGHKDSKGWTALIWASFHNKIKAVELLMDYESGNVTMSKMTALMWACNKSHQEIISLLYTREAGYTNEIGRTSLMLCAELGNSAGVELLAASEAGMFDRNRQTALMIAASSNEVSSVQALIGSNDVGLIDKMGRTALIHALLKGHEEAAELLVLSEAGHQGPNSNPALYYALTGGHLRVAAHLFELEKDLLYQHTGCTPLMLAAGGGYKELVELWLSDAAIRDREGKTALMYAAINGHSDCCTILIELEQKAVDNKGLTALMHAAQKGHLSVIHVLLPKEAKIQTPAGESALLCLLRTKSFQLQAANSGWTKTCKALLKAEKNLTNQDGLTPLMVAASNGYIDAVKLLTEHLKKQTLENGTTALMFAAENGHSNVVSYLLPHEKGMKDTLGRVALMYAAKHGHLECAKLLKVKGKEDFHIDSAGYSSLMYAAEAGNLDVVQLLRARQLKLRNKDGATALMLAAKRGHSAVVRALSEEMNCVDQKGKTALMYACESGIAETVITLGPEILVVDNYGHCAYDYAYNTGNYDLINTIISWKTVYLKVTQTSVQNYCTVLWQVIFAYINRKNLEEYNKFFATLYDSILALLFDDLDRCDVEEDSFHGQKIAQERIEELNRYLTVTFFVDMGLDCVICMDASPNTVLVPCRHMILCRACAPLVNKKCPYCRKKISEILVLSDV